jgi:hypothetical protein
MREVFTSPRCGLCGKNGQLFSMAHQASARLNRLAAKTPPRIYLAAGPTRRQSTLSVVVPRGRRAGTIGYDLSKLPPGANGNLGPDPSQT